MLRKTCYISGHDEVEKPEARVVEATNTFNKLIVLNLLHSSSEKLSADKSHSSSPHITADQTSPIKVSPLFMHIGQYHHHIVYKSIHGFYLFQKGSRHKNPENRKQMWWRQNLSHLLRRTRSAGSNTNNNVRENHQPSPHSTATTTSHTAPYTTQPQLNTNTNRTTTHTPPISIPVVTDTATTLPAPGKQSNGTSRQRQMMLNCVPHQTSLDIKRDDCFLDVDSKWSQQKQTSPKSSKYTELTTLIFKYSSTLAQQGERSILERTVWDKTRSAFCWLECPYKMNSSVIILSNYVFK